MKKDRLAAGLLSLLIIGLAGCGGSGSSAQAPVPLPESPAISESGQDVAADEPQGDNKFSKLLAENQDFSREGSTDVTFRYDMTSPSLEELAEKYDLAQVAGDGDTQDKAIRLLKWLSENVYHFGMYDNHVEQDALSLLEYSFSKGQEYGINCMALSTILTESLLSQGIYARTIWLMPGVPEDMDNHVITMAFILERDKWIFLDPTYNAYFSDDESNMLSPLEIREGIISSSPLLLNKDAHYNGAVIAESETGGYLEYLAKDMFYFYCRETQQVGRDDANRIIYLCPDGLDVTEWEIANLRYRQVSNPDPMSSEDLRAREQELRGETIIYTDPGSFWSGPA